MSSVLTVKRLQYLLAAGHGAVWFYCVVVAIQTPSDGLWVLIWLPLFLLDFPVTFLLWLALKTSPSGLLEAVENGFPWSSAPFPYSYLTGFWLPLVVYGVVGTLWMYSLPVLLLRLKGSPRSVVVFFAGMVSVFLASALGSWLGERFTIQDILTASGAFLSAGVFACTLFPRRPFHASLIVVIGVVIPPKTNPTQK